MERVELIINEFTDRLFDYRKVLENIKIHDSNLGLNGLPSIIVFLSEYGISEKINNKRDVSKILQTYVELLVESLNKEKKVNQTLSLGITGILYSLSVLSNFEKEKYKDLVFKIKNIFLSITLKYIDLLENNDLNYTKEEHFDFINGLSGNLAVLLAYYPDEKKCICRILEYFIKKFNGCDKKISVININPENIQTILIKKLYPSGYINFSVSHGIAFPLYLLVKSMDKGFKIGGLNETIDSLFNVFWKFCNQNDDFCYFSGRVSTSKKQRVTNIKKSQDSWCYGDLSIKRILYYVSLRLNKTEYINTLRQSILEVAEDDIKFLNFSSPTFCHGYSGFLSVIESISNIDSSLDFTGFKSSLIDEIVNFYNYDYEYCFKDYDYEYNGLTGSLSSDIISYDRLGILSGSVGIMLVLLSKIDSKVINWKKLFFE